MAGDMQRSLAIFFIYLQSQQTRFPAAALRLGAVQ
jgi:hypothetical protein